MTSDPKRDWDPHALLSGILLPESEDGIFQVHCLRQRFGGACGHYALFNAIGIMRALRAETADECADAVSGLQSRAVFERRFLDTQHLLLRNCHAQGSESWPWSVPNVTAGEIERSYMHHILRHDPEIARLGGRHTIEALYFSHGSLSCPHHVMPDIQARFDAFRDSTRDTFALVLGVTNHWVTIVLGKRNGRFRAYYCDSLNVPVIGQSTPVVNAVLRWRGQVRAHFRPEAPRPAEADTAAWMSTLQHIRQCVLCVRALAEGRTTLSSLAWTAKIRYMLTTYSEVVARWTRFLPGREDQDAAAEDTLQSRLMHIIVQAGAHAKPFVVPTLCATFGLPIPAHAHPRRSRRNIGYVFSDKPMLAIAAAGGALPIEALSTVGRQSRCTATSALWGLGPAVLLDMNALADAAHEDRAFERAHAQDSAERLCALNALADGAPQHNRISEEDEDLLVPVRRPSHVAPADLEVFPDERIPPAEEKELVQLGLRVDLPVLPLPTLSTAPWSPHVARICARAQPSAKHVVPGPATRWHYPTPANRALHPVRPPPPEHWRLPTDFRVLWMAGFITAWSRDFYRPASLENSLLSALREHGDACPPEWRDALLAWATAIAMSPLRHIATVDEPELMTALDCDSPLSPEEQKLLDPLLRDDRARSSLARLVRACDSLVEQLRPASDVDLPPAEPQTAAAL